MARSGRQHASSLLAWLSLRPALVSAVVGAASACAWAATSMGTLPDAQLFSDAGRALLSRDGLDVFADPELQIGPVYLAIVGMTGVIGIAVGVPAELLMALLLGATTGALAARLARWLRPPGWANVPAFELAAGVATSLASPLAVTAWSGHGEELLTGVALLGATALAIRDRHLTAGLLIGVASASKLAGVLGLAIVLVGSAPCSWRAAARRGLPGVVAAGTVLAATYLPFLAFGDVHTFDFSWMINAPAPLALIAQGDDFDLAWRLIQVTAALAVGAALANPHRPGPDTVWLVPVGIIATRLLLDPYPQVYYAAPLLLCVIVGLWASAPRTAWELPALATALAPVAWVGLSLPTGTLGSALTTVLLLLTVASAVAIRLTGHGRGVLPTAATAATETAA